MDAVLQEELFAAARGVAPRADDIRAFGARLPAGDEDLDALLAVAARGTEPAVFTNIVCAALEADRPVSARHLVEGAGLLTEPKTLTTVALKCEGDVAGALLETVRRGGLHDSLRAILLTAAAWWALRKGALHHRPDLVREARLLARRPHRPVGKAALCAVSTLLDANEIRQILPGGLHPDLTIPVSDMLRTIENDARRPIPEILDTRHSLVTQTGPTRRSAEKVGRNDPCPCGSGRKYKRCCMFGSRPASSGSSPTGAVGPAPASLSIQDEATLLRTPATILARLDPNAVREDLHVRMLQRLLEFRSADGVHNYLEHAGHRPEIDELVVVAMGVAAESGDHELVRRFQRLRPEGPQDFEPSLGAELILADNGPQPTLDRLEENALEVLDDEPFRFAHHVLAGPWPALAIHIARGVLAMGGGAAPGLLLALLRQARDRLGVPPEDPIEDVLTDLLTRNARDDDTERLHDTRAELVASEQAYRKKRAELLRLQSELSRVKRRIEAANTAAASSKRNPAADDETRARLHHLRQRLNEVQGEVAEGQSERSRLQEELDAARKENEALRAEKAAREAKTGRPDSDNEERLFPVDSSFDAQPARVPIFPADFAATLRRLPKHVGEAALVLAGRLAAGKRDAFMGCRGLVQLDRTVWRQRVGGPYRLLFELDGPHLRVQSVIHRSKLERWIEARA